MKFFLYDLKHEGERYVLLQSRPMDDHASTVVFDAPHWWAAIETVNQRVAVRQGADFHAPPIATGPLDVGSWRCRRCELPIEPLWIDRPNLRAWWADHTGCGRCPVPSDPSTRAVEESMRRRPSKQPDWLTAALLVLLAFLTLP